MNLCNLPDAYNFILNNQSKSSLNLPLGVWDYTWTIWPNKLYYSALASQSRLNWNQFKPKPVAWHFHSCSSLCIAKLCLIVSRNTLFFTNRRYVFKYVLKVRTSICVYWLAGGRSPQHSFQLSIVSFVIISSGASWLICLCFVTCWNFPQSAIQYVGGEVGSRCVCTWA